MDLIFDVTSAARIRLRYSKAPFRDSRSTGLVPTGGGRVAHQISYCLIAAGA
jgi:hypothetical protein